MYRESDINTTDNYLKLDKLKKLEQIIEDIESILFDYNTKTETRDELVEKLNAIYFIINKEV